MFLPESPLDVPRASCVLSVAIDGVDVPLYAHEFVGTDRVSELFRFEIVVSHEAIEGPLALEDLVGAKIALTLTGAWLPEGGQVFHGAVGAIDLDDEDARDLYYRVVMVPRVYQLTQAAHCRIFQDQTVVDIAEKVLTGHGLSKGPDFAFRGNSPPPVREFVVQYQETDWDFLQRLLEDEGIFYYFDHTDDGDLLIMGNEAANHKPITGKDTLPARMRGQALPDEEYVAHVATRRALRPAKVGLRDWHFPRAPAPVEAECGDAEKLVVEEYPGGFLGDTGAGRKRAKHRLDALRGEASVTEGQSCCPRLVAGQTFSVSGHVRDLMNVELVLVEVEHRMVRVVDADGAAANPYTNTFRAQPASLPACPLKKTPKPRISGVQTAMVVGPEGDEIYVDDLGRIRLKFHWDRRPPSSDPSLPVRVAQMWGSAKYGSFYIPRIGQEVVVSFEDGDPDRPLVVGTVYHAAGPLNLPAEKTVSALKTRSTPKGTGANELRFEDKKDAELITVIAQKDLATTVKNDETRDVVNLQTITVGADRSLTVSANETVDITKNQTISVGENQGTTVGGDHSSSIAKSTTIDVGTNAQISVGGTLSLTVSKDATETFSKNLTISVDADRKDSITKNYVIKAKKIQMEAEDLIIKVGESTLTMAKNGKVTLKVDKDFTLDAGGAIKLKAGKDVDIQAGGKANIKASGDVTIKGAKVAQN
jgi:type VI secretion system secreted protein VgrG